MPTSISQSRAILEGLRKLVRKAEAEFYQKPGVTDRFRVKAAGFNCFEVVERQTGKVVTQTPCFGYSNAYRQAIELDSTYSPLSIKIFGRALSNWALRIGAILTVFAFFGSHLGAVLKPQGSGAYAKPNTNYHPAGLKVLPGRQLTNVSLHTQDQSIIPIRLMDEVYAETAEAADVLDLMLLGDVDTVTSQELSKSPADESGHRARTT